MREVVLSDVVVLLDENHGSSSVLFDATRGRFIEDMGVEDNVVGKKSPQHIAKFGRSPMNLLQRDNLDLSRCRFGDGVKEGCLRFPSGPLGAAQSPRVPGDKGNSGIRLW